MENQFSVDVVVVIVVFVGGGGGDGAVAFLLCVLLLRLCDTVCRLLINSVFMRERNFSLCFGTLALPERQMFVFPHQILRL